MSLDRISQFSQTKRTLLRIAFLIASVFIAISGLLLVGAYTTSIPYLSFCGALVLSSFGSWVVLTSLMSAIVIWVTPSASTRRMRNYLVICAFLEVAFGVSAIGRILNVARENSIPINLLSTFSLLPVAKFPPDYAVVYDTFAGEPVRLAIYSAQQQHGPSPAPVLIFVHGGGWMEGDELYAGEMLHRLATQGWMVISAGYPLSSPQRHLWNQTTAQIGCALAWTNANAAQYGGDPQRISLLGQSAGGNLVLNAASLANAGTLPSSCEGLVPHVAAVVAVYPVVHLVEAYHNKAPFISKVGRAFFDAYTGGTPEQFPERYAVIDPASHINPTGPPTLIMVGEHDDLLPPQPTYRYADELRTAGVHVELMRLPFGQHAYDVMQGSIGYQLTLGMTRKFLSAQGQGPEPPQ